MQLLIKKKKKKNFSCTFFFNFWSSKPWIRIWIHLKCWIRVCIWIWIQLIRIHNTGFALLFQVDNAEKFGGSFNEILHSCLAIKRWIDKIVTGLDPLILNVPVLYLVTGIFSLIFFKAQQHQEHYFPFRIRMFWKGSVERVRRRMGPKVRVDKKLIQLTKTEFYA